MGNAVKRLIFINGTMGVGKSAVSHELKNLLAPCGFLDGDWCWSLTPFTVTEETKSLVLDNAAYLLNAFLRCSAVRNVLFCWVMPARAVIDDLLSRITEPCSFQLFTLTASERALCARLRADIAAGKRTQDVVARSLAYLPHFEAGMGGIGVDTSRRSAAETAQMIADKVVGKVPEQGAGFSVPKTTDYFAEEGAGISVPKAADSFTEEGAGISVPKAMDYFAEQSAGISVPKAMDSFTEEGADFSASAAAPDEKMTEETAKERR